MALIGCMGFIGIAFGCGIMTPMGPIGVRKMSSGDIIEKNI
jgi:hypothetical protein